MKIRNYFKVLPKANRLTKKKDFDEVAERGKGVGGRFLVLRFLKRDGAGEVKVGFIVSRKVSKKATVRNKVKRRLRENVRAVLPKIRAGYDLVFIARKGIEEKDFQKLKEEAEGLLKRGKLFINELTG